MLSPAGKAVAAIGLVVAGGITSSVVLNAASGAASSTPRPVITSGPTGAVASSSATFTFTDSAAPVAFQCAIDASAFTSCATPKTYTALAEGAHTFKVQAQTPGMAVSSAATRSFTVDSIAPPAPMITAQPANPTASRNARFQLADAEPGVQFRCRLDAGAFNACGSTAVFNALDVGSHCFAALAVDATGNQSGATTYCWDVILQGSFAITGATVGPLVPGASRPVNLVIGNPFNFTIRVTDVALSVDPTSSKSACDAAQNLTIVHSLVGTVDVPARATRSLQDLGVPQASWPSVAMPNLSTNQDACKAAVFTLHYTGTATKP